jgi:hypothetical protein
MKKIVFLIAIILLGCSAKQTKNSLLSGNYDQAIQTATESLRRDKDRKSKQEFVYMLEEAFAKAKERDERNIALWEQEKNPANIEKIYNTCLQLENRQEKIRPLLPLKLIAENRNAIFPFEDYSKKLILYKERLIEHLYDLGSDLLVSKNKLDARQAFNHFTYVNQLYPGYKDVARLLDEARFLGTHFVAVNIRNESGMIVPARLEQDLLDFGTMGLNDQWVVYHSKQKSEIKYDYRVVLNFVQILISPDQLKEREFLSEREVKDGKKKLVDRNGNVVRDSTGSVVMVDDLKTVRANINEFRQYKSCQVSAKVEFHDVIDNQLLQTFPLASEFVFENLYAVCQGDQRAVDDHYRKCFKNRAVPFPPNEQMVFDTGEDIKKKLKNIIVSYRF